MGAIITNRKQETGNRKQETGVMLEFFAEEETNKAFQLSAEVARILNSIITKLEQ